MVFFTAVESIFEMQQQRCGKYKDISTLENETKGGSVSEGDLIFYIPSQFRGNAVKRRNKWKLTVKEMFSWRGDVWRGRSGEGGRKRETNARKKKRA